MNTNAKAKVIINVFGRRTRVCVKVSFTVEAGKCESECSDRFVVVIDFFSFPFGRELNNSFLQTIGIQSKNAYNTIKHSFPLRKRKRIFPLDNETKYDSMNFNFVQCTMANLRRIAGFK